MYAVLALAIVGTLGGIAYKLDHNGFVRGKAEIQQAWDAANAEARAREAAASAAAAKALAAERAKRKIVIQEVTRYVDKIVDRPVYSNVCLDDDGLRCLGSAINGQDASGCKPSGAVPASTATDGQGR